MRKKYFYLVAVLGAALGVSKIHAGVLSELKRSIKNNTGCTAMDAKRIAKEIEKGDISTSSTKRAVDCIHAGNPNFTNTLVAACEKSEHECLECDRIIAARESEGKDKKIAELKKEFKEEMDLANLQIEELTATTKLQEKTINDLKKELLKIEGSSDEDESTDDEEDEDEVKPAKKPAKKPSKTTKKYLSDDDEEDEEEEEVEDAEPAKKSTASSKSTTTKKTTKKPAKEKAAVGKPIEKEVKPAPVVNTNDDW